MVIFLNNLLSIGIIVIGQFAQCCELKALKAIFLDSDKGEVLHDYYMEIRGSSVELVIDGKREMPAEENTRKNTIH